MVLEKNRRLNDLHIGGNAASDGLEKGVKESS